MLTRRFFPLHATSKLLRCYGRRRNFSFKHDLLTDLDRRGLIADVTKPEALRKRLEERQVIYSGIDPTAKALHVGHLVPLMCLLHFHLRGHRVLSVIGGATGMVGDPTGRATARTPIARETMELNEAMLASGIQRFFDKATQYAEHRVPRTSEATQPVEVINNKTWTKNLTLLDFLRDVGARARVNSMLSRDSVQTRLNSASGISFTEFAYQLLQAHDFYHLNKTLDCSIQLGGSDQWGNIVAGLDLIHHGGVTEDSFPEQHINPKQKSNMALRQRAFGITTPLLTAASGEKFGKSAGNAIWLNDRQQTSELDFYQFWLRTADADVDAYLRMFTLLDMEEIEAELKTHMLAPEKRHAQRLLANEVTAMVHGAHGLKRAQNATRVLFEQDLSAVNAEDLIGALQGDPRLILANISEITPVPLCKLAVMYQLVSSRAEATRLINMGGFYLNNQRINDVQGKLQREHLLDGRLAIIRAGKNKHLILAAQQDGLNPTCEVLDNDVPHKTLISASGAA